MKKILIITPYYLPSYKAGGPIRSISNLVSRYKDKYDFSIITPNNDLDGSIYKDTKPDEWNNVKGTNVFYVGDYKKFIAILKESNKTIDIIYINSMFSFKYSIMIVVLNYLKIINFDKIIIAPRGEFAPSALDIKFLKKKLFLGITKLFKIHKNIIWHATADKERIEIKNVFSDANILIANNLSSNEVIDNFEITKIKKIEKELHIVYVARIVPIKNLSFALEILKNISVDKTIYFDIYGPKEDEKYWEECQNIINNLPKNIIINYKGSIDNSIVLDTIKKYHLYFLPTKGENFGHSIAEALRSSCPVLISDQTPWRNLDNKNIGWDINLSKKEKFIDTIEYLLGLTHDEILELSGSVNIYIKSYLLDKEIDEKYKKLFK
jgi:glycosyltransferase involved in cell wall biosynthesis